MFTYIRLKNFKSLGDVTFDFRKKKEPESFRDVKQFIAIYGENGSGKSNFAESIVLLIDSMNSFREKCMSTGNSWEDYRTIDCNETSEAEYGILIRGKEFRYKMGFRDVLVYEELSCGADGMVFRVKSMADGTIGKEFREGVFSEEFEQFYVESEIDSHWGRYSFLGKMACCIAEDKYELPKAAIPEDIADFAETVGHMFASLHSRYGDIKLPQSNKYILDIFNEDNHSIANVEEEKQLLENTKKILDDFLRQAYPDIARCFYTSRGEKNGRMDYEFCIQKNLSKRMFCILPLKEESEGTHNSIEILRCLINVYNGGLSVCDGFDCGIHDFLLETMLLSAKERMAELSANAEGSEQEFTGQLIFTTHSTHLLNTLYPDEVYLISSDDYGEKSVSCMGGFNLNKRDSIRHRYIYGYFGGLPKAGGIDYTFA